MEDITLEREGKTLALSIDPAALDDMELYEDLLALDEGKVHHLPRVVGRLLGAEQKAALYDLLRTNTGRVSTSDVTSALEEIFDKVKNGKK